MSNNYMFLQLSYNIMVGLYNFASRKGS